MTNAELEALKKKTLAGGSAGVFSLDQLKALGQTGDARADWMAEGSGAAPGLIAGGGHAVIDPALNLPAGYYQIPGAAGAQYYNPQAGQVSQEFHDWASSGKIERDDLTGLPKALMSDSDSGDTFRQGFGQLPSTIKTLNDIFAYGKRDNTYQEAQDRTLGLGRYQQFLTDKNGKQIRIGDTVNPAAPSGDYRQLDKERGANAGAFDKLMALTGKTRAELEQILGGAVTANKAPIAPVQFEGQTIVEGTNETQATLEDSLAANYTNRAKMWKGLQEQREMRGLDPNTGTSEAEKKRIYETAQRITDPAQKAAFLKYQDPGNLTKGLRAERYAARAGEREQISQYEKEHPTVENRALYGDSGSVAGHAKINIGSQVVTDETTGRETFVGNIPVSYDIRRNSRTEFGKVAEAFAGGLIGGVTGFMTGGIFGAVIGAYVGAGGPFPNTKNISMKNSNGWGEWSSKGPHVPTGMELGSALAFSAMMGAGGKVVNRFRPGSMPALQPGARGPFGSGPGGGRGAIMGPSWRGF